MNNNLAATQRSAIGIKPAQPIFHQPTISDGRERRLHQTAHQDDQERGSSLDLPAHDATINIASSHNQLASAQIARNKF